MGWIQNVFGRKAAPMERKDTVAAPINAAVMSSPYAPFFTPQEIVPWMAWQLYANASSLARVVDLIADATAALEPMVRIDGEVVEDHPILGYMKRPGRGRTRQRLIKELAVQYLVTGNAYPIVYGNVNLPQVLMIDIARSMFITPVQGDDMWSREFWYSEGTRSARYIRDTSNPRDFRWFEPNGLSEIVPIYDMEGIRPGIGLSRLNAVKYDVETRMKGIQHNAAMLDNGARVSGVLSFTDQLTEEQLLAVKNDFRMQAQGAQNTGGVYVTAGGQSDFKQLSQNMKDMDFANLIKNVEDAIVTRYNVPVTVYNVAAQTNNNYDVAWEQFYEQAVLPCFNVVWGPLAQAFTNRIGQDIEIVHNPLSSRVLLEQAIGKARKLYDGHLISRNEARDLIGMEPVLGGDTIFGSVSDVAQAEDYFTNHGINDPGEQDNSLQAYQAVRPEANPANAAPASQPAEAVAPTAEPAKPVAKKPDTKKPAKKKPEKSAAETKADDAIGKLLRFADYVETEAKNLAHSGADPPTTHKPKKVA